MRRRKEEKEKKKRKPTVLRREKFGKQGKCISSSIFLLILSSFLNLNMSVDLSLFNKFEWNYREYQQLNMKLNMIKPMSIRVYLEYDCE